jgi:hypothetical protein
MWDKVKAQVEGFEIPKEVLEGKLPEGKTEEDLLLDAILDNTGPDIDDDDDFLPGLIAGKADPNFNKDDYIQGYIRSKQIMAVPADDLIFNALKSSSGKSDTRPNGYTDEQITEYVNGLNQIQKDQMADGIRQQYAESQRNLGAQKAQAAREKFNNELEATAQALANETDFFGIKVEPDKAKAYNARFKDYFKPDASGKTPFQKLMSDDKFIYKMLYVLDQDGAVLKNLGSTIKEGTKEALEIKLGLTDRLPAGGGLGEEHFKAVNWDDMTKPETEIK